jgi:hypothetical protein
VLPVGEPPDAIAHEAAHPRREALERAHDFLRALIGATHERGSPVGAAVIEARRRMRSLAPQLLAAYLARA